MSSMASASMRKVVSPRNLGSAFKSPKVNRALNAAIKGDLDWSPHSVASVPKKNSLSPFVSNVSNVLSPYSNTSKPRPAYASSVSRKSKSARKLPWSDGGSSPSPFESDHFIDSVQLIVSPVSRVDKCCHFEPSADTPDRAELIKIFSQKRSGLHILGKGTFGTVLEAKYKGQKVAVKIVPSTPEACRQVKNEMNCLTFHHPNIVSVLKVTPSEDKIAGIVIMERICGYSLQKFVDLGYLRDKVNLRFRYSMQIGTALAYCHKQRILHLDVKPQNVLVDIFTDTCKLCDFGCSSTFEKVEFSLQGTVGYVAPEILQGNKPTAAADVYSLGITMWQLMSGETPYKELRGHTVIYKVVAAEYRPELPEILCPEDGRYLSLVKRCWSQSAECRPTIEEVTNELHLEYTNGKPEHSWVV
ncbi:serine/threonine-protein kinase mos [Thrips palmi]|uniref:non-specific serine/threonine protein kinase n=1 Tax=Thrips palmi TaxID=161013 RepID=A0A6P9A8J1_THRPL|nr:serine/threonine-protein kinase mos [Thrips palmi]